jgi:hypothetical protein
MVFSRVAHLDVLKAEKMVVGWDCWWVAMSVKLKVAQRAECWAYRSEYVWAGLMVVL